MQDILYITTTLPSVTLTFVYREIEALISAGYRVMTVSMGKPSISQVSKEALALYHSTLYLDQFNLVRKIISFCRVVFTKPRICMQLLVNALAEKEIKGFRDKIRILYHCLEAAFLCSRLNTSRLQHIHAHFLAGPASIAYFLSRYLDIPFSFTMHASSIFTDHIMLKTQLLACRKAVTISDYNKRYLIDTYGNEFKDKIEVIHCGIDLQAFHPPVSEKPSPPIILAVGQLVKRKGFDYLVKACEKLKANKNEFQCWIVGDGPERQRLEQIVKQGDMRQDVLLLGRKPQELVKTYLQQASVFALPSIITDEGGREGIPVALMEAMAMQIPVVSTHTAGIPELIEHEKEGILVEQKNTHQLVSALEFFLKNSEARLKMGQQGRRKVEQHFNIAHVPGLLDPIFNGQQNRDHHFIEK